MAAREANARDRGMVLSAADDQTLWDAATAGDSEAFGELYSRHQHAVYTFCFRRVASWSVAEDLVSVVFLEAWRCRRSMNLSSGSALPWFIGIATRATQHHHRSRLRYASLVQRAAAEGVTRPAPLDDDVAGRVDDERRMAEVLVALEQLPKRQRDVVAACIFAGLDTAQAAIALSVPPGTVKSRLSRARRRLARALPHLAAHLTAH